MASNGISSPSEARVIIDNDFLDDSGNNGVEIDILTLTPANAFMHIKGTKKLPKAGIGGMFEPRGVSFNYGVGDQGGVDSDATMAKIDIQEKNEPYFHPFRGAIGILHPLRIRKIRVGDNTTARGIQIHQ